MDPFVRSFIRSSLVWLGLGLVLGIAMAVRPFEAGAWRPAHLHANLLGFVSLMIFGVAYHVMPRFAGNPLWSGRAAEIHLWLSNGGLAMMFVGWIVRPWWRVAGFGIPIGGVLAAAGGFLFIVNIWRTLGTGVPSPVRIESIATRSHSATGQRGSVRA